MLGLLAGLAGWGLSSGACLTLPCYPIGQGKQVRQASHTFTSLTSHSAPRGLPPPWLGPQTGTLSPDRSSGFSSRYSMGLCPGHLQNQHKYTHTTSTITPPHFLLFMAPGSASKASAVTEPSPGG